MRHPAAFDQIDGPSCAAQHNGMTVDMIIIQAGGVQALARIAEVNRTTVYSWRYRGQVSLASAPAISRSLQIPLHEIRPDIWGIA